MGYLVSFVSWKLYLYSTLAIAVLCMVSNIVFYHVSRTLPGIFLVMGSDNERRCCIVTPPLIGWSHTQSNPSFSILYIAQQLQRINFVLYIMPTKGLTLTSPKQKAHILSLLWSLFFGLQVPFCYRESSVGMRILHTFSTCVSCIFLNENVWIPNKISLRFVPKGPINNNPSLVQITAWRRPGNKPLSEPMRVNSPTLICVIRPQWVN